MLINISFGNCKSVCGTYHTRLWTQSWTRLSIEPKKKGSVPRFFSSEPASNWAIRGPLASLVIIVFNPIGF